MATTMQTPGLGTTLGCQGQANRWLSLLCIVRRRRACESATRGRNLRFGHDFAETSPLPLDCSPRWRCLASVSARNTIVLEKESRISEQKAVPEETPGNRQNRLPGFR